MLELTHLLDRTNGCAGSENTARCMQCWRCWRCVPEIWGAQKRSDEGGFLEKELLVIDLFFFFKQLYLGVIYIHIRSIYSKCIIQWFFSKLTSVCNHHHNPNLGCFCHFKKIPHAHFQAPCRRRGSSWPCKSAGRRAGLPGVKTALAKPGEHETKWWSVGGMGACKGFYFCAVRLCSRGLSSGSSVFGAQFAHL